MMVIVTIIGVMAALAAPGMMRAMSVNRAQRATTAVARLGRAGRSDAIAFGRSYLLRYDAGSTGRGNVELWRGTTDTCRTTPWAAIVIPGGCTGATPAADCVDAADMTNYSTATSWTQLTSPVTGICFEPDGDLWQWLGGQNFATPATALRMGLQRFESSVPLEERGVVFPLGGAPRTER